MFKCNRRLIDLIHQEKLFKAKRFNFKTTFNKFNYVQATDKDNIFNSMFKAVQKELEQEYQDLKSQGSPQPTDTTSFSDFHNVQLDAYQRITNQRKYSHPISRNRNWHQVESSVIEWLLIRGVRREHPEDIIGDIYDTSKKQVIKKISNTVAYYEKNSLQRKLGRKLTISL